MAIEIGAGSRTGTLGVLAGSGPLPLEIAAVATTEGHQVHIIGIDGFAGDGIADYPHQWVNLGQVGAMIEGFRRAGCADIVIAGGMRRPNLWKLKIDGGFFRSIGTVLQLTRGGDDSVLRRVVRFFELQGFRVHGAHEIAPHLLAPIGVLGRVQPEAMHRAAIEGGAALIRALGAFDVGQAAVASADRIIAVEGVGGTDSMIGDLAASLDRGGMAPGTQGSVLVKLPKPGQEMRIDLPVIGPSTIDALVRARLAGVAVRAGQSLILEREETVRRADAAGVFIIGIEDDPAATAPAERAHYIDPHGEPLAVLGRRAPTPGERRDVAIGRALMRALAQYDGGQAAIISDQHVRGIDGALPIDAMVQSAAAGNDWGRRLFKKRIGVLVVRRPELILDVSQAVTDADVQPVNFEWIAAAGLSGIACVEAGIPEALLPAASREANDMGLFLMAPETRS